MELREIIKKVLYEQPGVALPPNMRKNPVTQSQSNTSTTSSSSNTTTTTTTPKSVNIDFVDVNQDLIDAYGISLVKQAYEKQGITVKQEGDKLQIKGLLPKSYFYNNSTWKFGRGPKGHKEVGTGNDWHSLNAWDMMAHSGTQAHSLTHGKVSRKSRPNTDNQFLWGDQMTVQGIGGYPDIYYTHITSPLKVGDEIFVGSPIGTIDLPKNGNESLSHLHIGLPYGYDINSLLS